MLNLIPTGDWAYTWHTFTPELAERFGWDAEKQASLTSEQRSKVTFEIEPADPGVVRLTVTHDGFGPDSMVLEGVGVGWPDVISGLKTLLETGEPLSSGTY